MAMFMDTPPVWYALSHRDRYRRLQEVREAWCRRRHDGAEDRVGLTVDLEGHWITDVSSFYLALGEAINGPNGYFGSGLDALADCLCGGFGVLPPLTIRLSHWGEVRKALDGRAWSRFQAEHFHEASAHGESTAVLVDNGYIGAGSDSDVAYWISKYEAAFVGESCECDEFTSYFDAILEVLTERGAQLLPALEPAIQ